MCDQQKNGSYSANIRYQHNGSDLRNQQENSSIWGTSWKMAEYEEQVGKKQGWTLGTNKKKLQFGILVKIYAYNVKTVTVQK